MQLETVNADELAAVAGGEQRRRHQPMQLPNFTFAPPPSSREPLLFQPPEWYEIPKRSGYEYYQVGTHKLIAKGQPW